MNETTVRSLSVRKTARTVLMICVLLWLVSGLYIVKADEAGVVRRFGRVLPIIMKPGIHYHLPYPLESLVRPRTTEVKSMPIGFPVAPKADGDFKTLEKSRQEIYGAMEEVAVKSENFYPALASDEQSEYLTGDENIIHGRLILQYSISDPIAYLTAVSDIEALLRNVTEAAFMAELGATSVDDALTSGKVAIINNIRRAIQTRLDEIGAGIAVVAVDLRDLVPPREVENAFKDVFSARGDAARMIHEAEGAMNEALPQARGEAERTVASAEAYQLEATNHATGDAERFNHLFVEYHKSPAETRKRLYLETMSQVFPRMKKYFLGTKAGEKSTKVTLFMDELLKNEGR
ncbi:MAG: FtsH protease activity modulator HflK [Myxococcales bacterium]|nr:FtsH protease activity modulator HflK [Myxococcales bacterium]